MAIKKPTGKKAAGRARIARGKYAVARNASKRTAAEKTARRQATIHKRRPRRKKPIRGKGTTANMRSPELQGLDLASGGQAGDIQGLTHFPTVDSESVEELAEEGQSFEAGIVGAVENAPDADEAEVTTREVPEGDVPPEYRGRTEKERP